MSCVLDANHRTSNKSREKPTGKRSAFPAAQLYVMYSHISNMPTMKTGFDGIRSWQAMAQARHSHYESRGIKGFVVHGKKDNK